MCGGRGTRLGGETEKPLREITGRPMVDRVLDALVESRIETTHTIVSPHATRTRERLAARANDSPSLSIVDAPGTATSPTCSTRWELSARAERPS